MAYIGKEPIVGNFQKCDAITVVNGQAAYTLQVSSTNVVPESANHMLVSLNGILQAPVTSFTVSGSTLTFASNLATGDVIDFVILLGNVLDLGTVSDGTITNAKLASDIISGETDIGGAIADADLFLIDDGAGGTLRKTAASRIKTYAGGANTPAFQAYASSSQSQSNDTFTKIECDTEDFDVGGNYDHSTNYRFTPTTSGKYLIYGQAHCNAGTGNVTRLTVAIYKNGTDVAKQDTFIDTSDAVLTEFTGLTTTVESANGSSDYFELYARLRTYNGSTITIEGGAGKSFFGAYKIIE